MNSGVRNRTDSSRKRRESQSRVSDITRVELKSSPYDVWHDRAVLHFLTAAADRIAYVRQVAHAVKRGGRVIVSTFGPEGPERCCGLDVVRYDAESLHREFGIHFPCWEVPQSYTARRLGQSSSFSIATAVVE